MYLYIDENRENNSEKDHIENYESYLEDMVQVIETTDPEMSGDCVVCGIEDFGIEVLYDMVVMLNKRIAGEDWINKR